MKMEEGKLAIPEERIQMIPLPEDRMIFGNEPEEFSDQGEVKKRNIPLLLLKIIVVLFLFLSAIRLGKKIVWSTSSIPAAEAVDEKIVVAKEPPLGFKPSIGIPSDTATVRAFESLRKTYKDTENKKSEISAYEEHLAAKNKYFEGIELKNWPKSELQQREIWTVKVANIKKEYNDLAADYNIKFPQLLVEFPDLKYYLDAGAPLPESVELYPLR